MGRPSSYKDEYAEQARRYSLLGATDVQMAEFFGVSEQTLNKWKKDFPVFLESLKSGKCESDAKVAEKLYTRAIGYSYTEVKTEETPLGTRTTRTTKEVVPDTTAQIFWLKNRQRDKWNNSDGPLEDDVVEPKTVVYNVAPPVSTVKVTNAKPTDAE